ncbi:MAG: dUTP diphosphatase [Anaerovoracaceae bacterium]|nr:dUTP diphosphatase [Bacillota bacterium]MDY2670216.1 dUTP diphosphatase [Anaerovoracaceae bacterium]
MEIIRLKTKKLDERAHMPKYASETAAGMDLYALMDAPLIIHPGQTVMIHTGLAMEIPKGYAGFVYARSGLAVKQGLAPANKVGVVDSDYRGEIMIALYNHSDQDRVIEDGERAAQMVIAPVQHAWVVECDELSDTERGEGGFGSTGIK